MEEKNYRVLRIEEQLYGCEELPEGQPVLCDVLLEAADGTQRVLPYPDAELTRLDINEGSTVTLRDHRLTKAAHKVYFTLRHDRQPPDRKRPCPGPGAGRKAPGQRSPDR